MIITVKITVMSILTATQFGTVMHVLTVIWFVTDSDEYFRG